MAALLSVSYSSRGVQAVQGTRVQGFGENPKRLETFSPTLYPGTLDRLDTPRTS